MVLFKIWGKMGEKRGGDFGKKKGPQRGLGGGPLKLKTLFGGYVGGGKGVDFLIFSPLSPKPPP